MRLFAVIGLFAVLALSAACSSEAPHGGPGEAPGQGIYVQEQWGANRRVVGHRVHVVEQRIACNSCHELEPRSIGAVLPARCAACHEAESHIEHAARQAQQRLGPQVHADCLSCHAFTSDGAQPDPPDAADLHDNDGGLLATFGPKDCARCHREAQRQTPAIVVHASAPCVSCHRPHQDQKPVSAPCANCHATISTNHAASGKTPNGVCTTCHTHQHAAAADALTSCVECHAKSQPLVPASALFAAGHTQCVTCHRPHEFEAKRAVPCRSCHAETVVLAQAKVPAHALCASCHSPHDVRGTPAARCATCHWDVHADHPGVDGHVSASKSSAAACVTCHDPHPARQQALVVARACSSCHRTATTDRAFHSGVECRKCHTPHHFKLELSQHVVCSSCHHKELALTAVRPGHAACQSCHAGLPHQPTVTPSACASCHAKEQHSVRVGHQQCAGCHEPHGGGIAHECKSCHVQEFASAPVGHRACANCHQPHTGSIEPEKCSSCHQPEAASAHGQLASGCLSCHRPHGPNGLATSPACTSCHAVASLPGLHRKSEKHRQCRTCHGGHGDAPNAQRSICLTCHTDRSSHFPGARCANCHLFQSDDALKAR